MSTQLAVPPYKAYSIPPLAHVVVNWATNSKTLYAYYEGSNKEPYLVKCDGDVNEEIKPDTAEWQERVTFLNDKADRKDKIILVVK